MHRRLALFLTVALAALLGPGCQSSGGDLPPPSGDVLPTVAGRPPATFPSPAEARRAFTRSSGSLTATLEDAAWLRYEGPPEEVAKRHRAYFDYGYTTFDVETRSSDFANPTRETFVLEDSAGNRVCGHPTCYEGSPTLVDERYFTTFSLSFQHVITRDLTWIRLTRTCDGSSLEWRFQAPQPPCAPGAGPPPASPGR